jgi:hypothetical protein
MRIVPARSGGKWLARGFALFRKSPSMWLLLVFGYWLTVALLGQLPYLGPALSMVLLPAFTMSFMILCATLESGGSLQPALLLAGFRTDLRGMATLGVLYFISIVLVLAISSLADDGSLLNSVLAGRQPAPEAIADGRAARALLLAAVAGTPVFLAFWFAPPLVGWDRMGAMQSLFYSFFAGWRNWRAFLVYGAILMLAGVVLLAALTLVAAVTRGQVDALRSMLLLFTVFSLPVLFGSFYASYRDVFPEGKVAPVGLDVQRGTKEG